MLYSYTTWLSTTLLAVTTVHALDFSPNVGPPPGSNPLTWGFYATPEVQKPSELHIEGSFPSWLSGSLYRGASATWDVGNYTAEHWFDGFSRNHRFEISNGVVTYRSRNASDELQDFVAETGRYPSGSFGSDPCKIIFGAFETTFRDGQKPHGNKSSTNVDVSWAPDFPGLARNGSEPGGPFETLVTTTDGNFLQQIDPISLEPIEIFTYQASNLLLNDSGRSAAHPAHASDGSLYNYVLDTSTKPPVYRIFGIEPPNSQARILANITDAPPAYLHSVFNTLDHIILIVWQADLAHPGKTVLTSLGPWDPKRKTLFYVVDRHGGGIVSKYEAEETFFAFHQINSFEDSDGSIIVDLPTMEDYSFLEAANITNLRANVGSKTNGSSSNDVPGCFTRYKLPAPGHNTTYANGTLISQRAERVFQLPYQSANIELPRINQNFAGKPYQYAYGVHLEQKGYFTDSLVKIDLKTREPKVWTPSTKQLPSEPIFVASPNATKEDDGILLTVVMDSAVRKSALVVLDASTMQEMGRAQMPIVMSYGFHGAWGST
ncbi:hypothetical protein MMC13_007296 [Lambiella insularis]|nr:hypothetical protein [Lambiella insularis]